MLVPGGRGNHLDSVQDRNLKRSGKEARDQGVGTNVNEDEALPVGQHEGERHQRVRADVA
eukprot:1082922-Rhodomonas_salina.4